MSLLGVFKAMGIVLRWGLVAALGGLALVLFSAAAHGIFKAGLKDATSVILVVFFLGLGWLIAWPGVLLARGNLAGGTLGVSVLCGGYAGLKTIGWFQNQAFVRNPGHWERALGLDARLQPVLDVVLSVLPYAGPLLVAVLVQRMLQQGLPMLMK